MVEARRSPLPREAQEQTTCDRWEEPRVGAAGSLPSLATRLLGADFRKGKCCAGAALPVVAAARASGQAQQIRGCCPTPGGARGAFPGQEPWPEGPRLGTICRCPPWVRAGGPWGWRDLRGARGTVASLFGSLQSDTLLSARIQLGPGYLLPASHYLQALSVLHMLTQFPWPVLQALSESPLPLPPGSPQPLAGVLWETPFLPEGRLKPRSL